MKYIKKIQAAYYKILTFFLIAPFCNSFGRHTTVIKPLSISGLRWISIGSYTRLNPYSFIVSTQHEGDDPSLMIGDGVTIGHFNHIVASKQVRIGDNVLTADKVFITDSYHGYEDVETPVINQPILSKRETSIGEGTWIGENVSIISSNIGRHCVIGANSVVLHDIPDYCIAVGNPAKVVKKYNKKLKMWTKANE